MEELERSFEYALGSYSELVEETSKLVSLVNEHPEIDYNDSESCLNATDLLTTDNKQIERRIYPILEEAEEALKATEVYIQIAMDHKDFVWENSHLYQKQSWEEYENIVEELGLISDQYIDLSDEIDRIKDSIKGNGNVPTRRRHDRPGFNADIELEDFNKVMRTEEGLKEPI